MAYKANKRGNMIVKIMDKEFKLRPSFQAMLEFEERTGLGVFEALSGLEKNKINQLIIVSAIWAGIRGGRPGHENKCPAWDEVGEMCFDEGMAKCLHHALRFLTLGLAGSEEAEAALRDPKLQGQETNGDFKS